MVPGSNGGPLNSNNEWRNWSNSWRGHAGPETPSRPIVRRFDVHVGRCRRYDRQIQPRDRLQTSNAVGAAASRLGPGLQALIAMMKDKYGLSYRETKAIERSKS
ncbi:MAG: hypothetical protein P8Z79_14810 [Sedimentisphaerales bacterium]|jgi:hypothetical protein